MDSNQPGIHRTSSVARRGLTALSVATLVGAMLTSGAGIASAAGGTLYVDDDASSGGDCLSVDTACQTIQAAIDKADPGDTVIVAAGEYEGSVTIKTDNIQLIGHGSGDTKITGSNRDSGISITADGVTIENISISSFDRGIAFSGTPDGATLKNVTSSNNMTYGLEVSAKDTIVSDLTIQHSSFDYNKVGFKVATTSSVSTLLVEDSTFNRNSGQGWYIGMARESGGVFNDVTVEDTSFNFNGKGLYFEKLSNAVFDGITVEDNGSACGKQGGFSTYLTTGKHSNITIENSTISDNGCDGDYETRHGYGISFGTVEAQLLNVTVKNNIISGNQIGVKFSSDSTQESISDAVVSNNKIVDNVHEGLLNQISESLVDATGNWWGSALPAFDSLVTRANFDSAKHYAPRDPSDYNVRVDGWLLEPNGEPAAPISACEEIVDAPVSTNVHPAGWTFDETRVNGHYEYVDGGLHVWTPKLDPTDYTGKAAGYISVDNLPIAAIGVPSISFASFSGVRPSMQIVVSAGGDGAWSGILVGEPWAWNSSEDLWWTSKDFGVPRGGGYEGLGTLDEFAYTNPNMTVIGIGFSLGSGVQGDATITEITMGCTRYSFDYEAPATNNPGGGGVINPPAPGAPDIDVLGAACEEGVFPDVAGTNPFCAAIAWMKGEGITLGGADGKFHPTQAMTRGMMAGFLYRLENGGTAPACTSKPYDDVAVDNAFCGAIAWMKAQGITAGSDDGGFHPGSTMTRGAMAAFLYRMNNDSATAPACTAKPFPDVATDSTFCGEIAWMKAQKISLGSTDGGFHAGESVTRQVMAGFLYRMSLV